jgi:3-oxoacyl-[acyl-carrier-protein] synthase II
MNGAAARVVITGSGAVTPLGLSAAATWQRLAAGDAAVREWPDLLVAGYRCARACRIEAFKSEPLRRGRALAIAAAEQAVESAAIDLPAGTGVFIGSTLGESEAFERAAEGADIDVAGFGVASFGAGIRARFGLRGPSQSLATACAAGNYAVGAALAALRAGRIDVALAGGAEPFSRLAMVGFSRSRAMAADACRPFDAQRSGMLLGEGAAMFVLERADDALRRGAVPLAEVLALGLSCDAHHPTAPRPDGSGMRAAMQNALDAAGIAPAQVDWVNAHGTGTRASDAAEALALRDLFGSALPQVSGSKGALGHALGAAAAIELAICLEALHAQVVPPTAGHATPDAPAGVACTRALTPARLRWAMNNAFAFGGLNSALLLRAWEA